MAENIVWGLDIGGTKCAIVAANEQGDILYRHQIATRDYPRWEDILETLVKAGEAHMPRPLAVGVSCGGPLDSQKGLVLSPPNLPGWDEVPVTAWLQERLHVPAYLQNDANACALAEWQYGAGKGSRSMAFLTFGTGLGAGLILDGRLYEGVNGMAGEIGHIRMAEDGPVGYGKDGSLEGFCSGGGLAQLAKMRLGKEMSARDLAEAAEQGDAGAIQVLHESARMLGKGLAILVDLLNLEKIVIGSIFARAEKWFRPEMEKMLEKEALGLSLQMCHVVPAALGEKIGDLAAVTIAWIGWRGENK